MRMTLRSGVCLIVSSLVVAIAAIWEHRSPFTSPPPGNQPESAGVRPPGSSKHRRSNALRGRPPELWNLDRTGTEPQGLPLWEQSKPMGTEVLGPALRAFREGKRNIFFDEERFVASWLKREPALLDQIETLLMDVPRRPIQGIDDVESPPDEIVGRMIALDILETLARDVRTKNTAEGVLSRLVQKPLAGGLDDAATRNVVVEKMEAMEALCRSDVRVCADVLDTIEYAPLHAKLELAALRGMIDVGFSLNFARPEPLRNIGRLTGQNGTP